MNCKEAIEYLLEHAEGKSTPASEHVRSCASCTKEVESLRATLAMLDEWTAPEPTPYFDQRLQARLREERENAPAGFFAWLRKPALAAVFAVVLAAGVALIRLAPGGNPSGTQMATVHSTSAVADLQSLDKNEDLYANFDLLDDLPHDAGQPVEQ